MTIECAEFIGWDAAWDGKKEPSNPEDWADHPELLAAWNRGWQQFQDWE